MTKADIIKAAYRHIRSVGTQVEATRIVDEIFETIKETLARGERIKITGLGSFVLLNKWERRGRNPRTGERIVVAARRVVVFRPSLVLRKKVNDAAEGQGDDSEQLSSANE